MKRIVKLLKLPWAEKRILLRSFFLLCFYFLYLRVAPFSKIAETCMAKGGKARKPVSTVAVSRTLVLFEKVRTGVFSFSCLPSALAAYHLLARQGVVTSFHIGVKKKNGELDAHAWLTMEGEVVVGWLPELDEYAELPLEKWKHQG